MKYLWIINIKRVLTRIALLKLLSSSCGVVQSFSILPHHHTNNRIQQRPFCRIPRATTNNNNMQQTTGSTTTTTLLQSTTQLSWQSLTPLLETQDPSTLCVATTEDQQPRLAKDETYATAVLHAWRKDVSSFNGDAKDLATVGSAFVYETILRSNNEDENTTDSTTVVMNSYLVAPSSLVAKERNNNNNNNKSDNDCPQFFFFILVQDLKIYFCVGKRTYWCEN